MKSIEEILNQCLDDIKEGKSSLENCLERYPYVRSELEPLLRIALRIEEPSSTRPSDAFKVKARVNLMEYIHNSQLGKRTAGSPSRVSIRHWWNIAWARAVAIAVTVMLVISAAGTGTAYAAQSSLPGDTLYSIKLGTEQLQRIITFDNATEVELELKLANIRLDELEELVSMPPEQIVMSIRNHGGVLAMSVTDNTNTVNELGEIYDTHLERITVAIDGYRENLNLAITKSEKVSDGETYIEMVALAILNHLDRLDKIEDMAADDAQETIVDAKDITINGHIRTLQNLAVVNPVRATEINLQAIQGRLDRANSEAAEGNSRGMEDALQDYEKLRRFGGEISNSAGARGQDTKVIDEMNARATTGHLETMGTIYGNVPEETKGAVEQAVGVAVEEHRKAVQGLQEQGAQGDIPTDPPLPENIPDDTKKNLQGLGPNDSGDGRR